MTDSSATDRTFSKPEGTILADQFRIEAVLGGGGMSIVYRCLDTRLGRTVAVKEMLPGHLTNDRSHLRFHQEAKAVGRLNHPNIVRLHKFEIVDETPYIVMDYIEGIPLSELIAESSQLSEDRSLEIALQIADALEHAHEQSVVHRDLKPSNIMLRQDGSVVLVDFGIAKLATTAASIKATQTGEVFGSPAYMSPEQISGRSTDGRTDQYALGCILFECLTGRTPFVGGAPLDVMSQHLNDAPPNAALYSQRRINPMIEEIIGKLLQKEPANRFENMAAVRRSLEAARDNLTVAKKPRLPLYAQKLPIALGATLLAIICGLAIFAAQHTQHTSEKPIAKTNAPQPPAMKPIATDTALKQHEDDERTSVEDWIRVHQAAKYVPILAARPAKRYKGLHDVDERESESQNALAQTGDRLTTDEVFMITDADLARLSDVHGITKIDLDNCENLSGTGLAKLDGQAVRDISCRASGFTDDGIKNLSNFPLLDTLNVSSSAVSSEGLKLLVSKAPKLKTLRINFCTNITGDGLAPLLKMAHLQYLEIKGIPKKANGMSFLSKSKLIVIKAGTSDVDDEDLKSIAQDKHLEQLSLDGSGSFINGSGLKYLTCLPLRFIDIGDCNVTKTSPAVLAFRKAMPHCEIWWTKQQFDSSKAGSVLDYFGH